jgi:hypothetical protein
MKDAWSDAQRSLHFDPVPEVVTHVVTAKGEHRHRIAANLANRTGCGGSGF